MPFSRSLTPRPTAPLSMTDSSTRRQYLPVGVNGSVGDDGCFDSGQASQLPCQSIGRANAAVESKRVSQAEQARQPPEVHSCGNSGRQSSGQRWRRRSSMLSPGWRPRKSVLASDQPPSRGPGMSLSRRAASSSSSFVRFEFRSGTTASCLMSQPNEPT